MPDVRANGWKAETADDVVSHEIRIKLKEKETKNSQTTVDCHRILD